MITVEFGVPWGPLLLPSRGPRAPYFTQEGPMGPPTVGFPPRKKFRGCREKNFPLHGRILAICFYIFYKIQ